MLSLAPATRFIVPIEWGRNTGSTCRHSGGVLRRGCPQDLAGRRQRGARSSDDSPIASSSSRTCVSIADGAAPMIVVTD
ncbi:Uncharacterised protein [Burkholderia cepacia]|nr:hypothetical protein DM41_6097 [Burkholderia cepacia ATCC 25416]SPU75868.1 Uncharacterised protein [Burkholderia cepacia]